MDRPDLLRMFEAGGGAYTPQARSEIVVVKRVETVLDRIVIHVQGAVTVDRGAATTAYKIGRSFRHFGHNAPLRIAALNELTGRAIFNDTVFDRRAVAAGNDFYSPLADNELALDSEVNDLPAGGKRLVQRTDGFDATIVSGAVVYRHGEPTAALPGRLVRGARQP